MSLCIFSALILEAVISPRSPGSSYWKMVFRNQIWMLSVLIASRVSLLLDTRQTELGNLYTLKPIFIKKIFLLEYSCITILCSFLLYSKVNQLYVSIYSFLDFLPIEVTTEH